MDYKAEDVWVWAVNKAKKQSISCLTGGYLFINYRFWRRKGFALAHKKGLGSSRNGRDSNGQRLGVKAYGGERVNAGTIIIRQRGTRIMPGLNVGLAKDDSIFATADGVVKFERKGRDKKIVSIIP